jgi:hypothetical protein
MMKLIREQNKLKNKTAKWVSKSKVALYRNGIVSVQARHQLEDLLGKVVSPSKRAKTSKAIKKVKNKIGKKSNAKNQGIKHAHKLW